MHEIAAAYIVGGFIVAYRANPQKGDFWRGLVIIIAATLFAMGHV